MAKKPKGKQKQDDKPAADDVGPIPPPTNERVNVMSPETTTQVPVQQEGSWGAAPMAGGWGTGAGDSWGGGGGGEHQEAADEQWDHPESLLQPPQTHNHSYLPTIPEQPTSGQYIQNRTALSDVGESQDEYSDSWGNQHGNQSPQQWDGPPSRTLTAPSAAGSPAPPPPVSLAEAAMAAQKDTQKKFSSASEAARRLEENKGHPVNSSPMFAQPSMISPAGPYDTLTRSNAHAVQAAATQKPMSSASAAAAALEASMNRRASHQPAHHAQPSSNGKTAWEQHKPFVPSTKEPRQITIDPSWIATGGNAWSNKHRAAKTASADNWGQPTQNAWTQQQMHQYHQPQQQMQMRQAYEAPRPKHNKHHSHPGHPVQHGRQQQQGNSSKQDQSWQGWGKEGWAESQGTETESDDETMNGWGAHAGSDAWGQGGGGAGAWGQPSSNHGKQDLKRDRGRTRGRKADDHRSQGQGGAWGQNGGDWGQGGGGGGSAAGWGKGGEEWKTADAWEDQGNDGWGQGNAGHADNGWGQTQENTAYGQPGDAWGAPAGGGGEWGGRAPSNAEWGPEPQRAKVAFQHAPAGEGSRNVLSPQQRSQILNSLLNQSQNQNPKGPAAPAIKQVHSQQQQQQQHSKPQTNQDQWGVWEAEDTGWGSEDDSDEGYDEARKVRFSPKASDIWGGSPRSVPSKAIPQGHQGLTALINDASNVRFVESRGAGLAFVSNAFFGNSRLARERLYWLFPSDKDQRVASMLAWVQKMSFNLGTYGLMKFLENQERGALFLNAAFRMQQHPHEPAFDFLTFNQLQGTMDKTLQESVAFYDPAALVIVFVFLPSESGNSVAIWRRKINVPDSARLKYQADINAIVKNLRKDKEYIVMVDELPSKPKHTVPQKPGQLKKSLSAKATTKAKATAGRTAAAAAGDARKKRKWWKLFLG